MKLTVLGSEPAWPSASRACSGYLVESGSTQVLVDCGTGVFAALRAIQKPEALTAILISHIHFDHWVDLIPFRYYLSIERQGQNRLPLFLPPGAGRQLAQVVAPVDGAADFFNGTFDMSEYDPDVPLAIQDLSISFRRTSHPVDTFAMRITSQSSVLTYTADAGPDSDLVDFAANSDLLLAEAAYADGPGGPVHLTAAQAAEIASQAGVGRLVLTHLAETRAEAAVDAARAAYDKSICYARANLTIAADKPGIIDGADAEAAEE